MVPNIVLIGFMGCGKTSVGRNLAALTGHRFLDTDHLVADRARAPITEIFANWGEAFFRRLETEVLRDLVGVSGVVIATGGGGVLREENRGLLHRIGEIVWLDAEPDVLFERASRGNRRPLLLTEEPRKAFDGLRAGRLPIYRELADLRIDSTRLTHEEVARAALEGALRSFAKKRGASEDGAAGAEI